MKFVEARSFFSVKLNISLPSMSTPIISTWVPSVLTLLISLKFGCIWSVPIKTTI